MREGTISWSVGGSAAAVSLTEVRSWAWGGGSGPFGSGGSGCRGQVRDALEVGLRHRLHQRVDPHALGQVQLHGAEFDEEVVVAAAAEGDVPVPRQDAAVHDGGAGRAVDVHRDEAHGVAWPELAQFPSLLADDRGRADEAAEGRAVGAEEDRHVARVVDGADRVRGVVDVGRVQARLAAVGAGPAGLRADQADTCARRVEVDLPLGRVEVADVVLGEELRCRVRTFDRRHVPYGAEDRAVGGRHRRALGDRAAVQDVTGAQRPAAVPAEPAQREGARAAEEAGDVQAARDQHVGAQAVFGRSADLQDRSPDTVTGSH